MRTVLDLQLRLGSDARQRNPVIAAFALRTSTPYARLGPDMVQVSLAATYVFANLSYLKCDKLLRDMKATCREAYGNSLEDFVKVRLGQGSESEHRHRVSSKGKYVPDNGLLSSWFSCEFWTCPKGGLDSAGSGAD